MRPRVGKWCGTWKVHVEPGLLGDDAWTDTKSPRGRRSDDVDALAIRARVVNRLARHDTPIAEQMGEEKVQ